MLPWKVATNTMSRSTRCIRDNAGIIKQVYLPQFLLSLIIMVTNSIKLLFGLMLLFAMTIFFKIQLSWHIIEFIPVYIVFFLFYWSISLFLTHFGVIFDDMKNLIGYVLMFWFFASPGMWMLDMLPENLSRIVWLNPNVTFFESIRNVFMYQQSPNYKWLGIWLLVSFVFLLISVSIVYRSEKNYSKAI